MTDVAHYNFNANQLILVIFGRDIAEWVRYWIVICDPTSHNWCLHYLGKNEPQKLGLFIMLYTVYAFAC